jgi:hypothetical protein
MGTVQAVIIFKTPPTKEKFFFLRQIEPKGLEIRQKVVTKKGKVG